MRFLIINFKNDMNSYVLFYFHLKYFILLSCSGETEWREDIFPVPVCSNDVLFDYMLFCRMYLHTIQKQIYL